MTLEQIIETVLIRATPSTSENSKQVFRFEIEALVPGAIVRMYNRLRDMGKASKLLKTEVLTCTDGSVTLPSNTIASSLESRGDGYVFFADVDANQHQPISYEAIYENRFLIRAMPSMYFYSLAPADSGNKIVIYKGDGQATAPDSPQDVNVTALFLPDSSDVDTLDVETTELLIEALIEILRERSREDQIPAFNPATVPTSIKPTPNPQ